MTYDKDSFLAGLSVGMSLRYSKRIPAPPNYLTFSSPSSFTLSVNNSTKNWDGTLESSTDMQTWTVWDGTTTISSVASGETHYLYFRGIGNTTITGNSSNYRWVISGSNISCNGDIRTLLNYIDVNGSLMASYCFAYLFYNCTGIISAPLLPATTLADYCYYSMFYQCTSLTEAPQTLPATQLADYCYGAMFRGCSSLTTAPSLPATSLAQYCYWSMFYGCASLIATPTLSSTELARSCYLLMFSHCESLVTITYLPATTLAQSCYMEMFEYCTSLEALPLLPATTLNTQCYAYMFRGCSKIKISATQDGEYQNAYYLPPERTGFLQQGLTDMFTGTGGSFSGTPSGNTTYYTRNTVIS